MSVLLIPEGTKQLLLQDPGERGLVLTVDLPDKVDLYSITDYPFFHAIPMDERFHVVITDYRSMNEDAITTPYEGEITTLVVDRKERVLYSTAMTYRPTTEEPCLADILVPSDGSGWKALAIGGTTMCRTYRAWFDRDLKALEYKKVFIEKDPKWLDANVRFQNDRKPQGWNVDRHLFAMHDKLFLNSDGVGSGLEYLQRIIFDGSSYSVPVSGEIELMGFNLKRLICQYKGDARTFVKGLTSFEAASGDEVEGRMHHVGTSAIRDYLFRTWVKTDLSSYEEGHIERRRITGLTAYLLFAHAKYAVAHGLVTDVEFTLYDRKDEAVTRIERLSDVVGGRGIEFFVRMALERDYRLEKVVYDDKTVFERDGIGFQGDILDFPIQTTVRDW